MSGRRMAFLVVAVLGLFISLSSAIQRWIVYPQFQALQGAAVDEALDRLLAALGREQRGVSSFCADYAEWDDAWAFIETRDPEFLRGNFTPSSFTRGNFNLVWIVARDGTVLYRAAYDPATKALEEVTDREGEQILEGHAFLTALAGAPTSGVMSVAQGVALVAVHPILTSEGRGPARGVMAMGRLLGPGLERSLTEQVRLPVTIRLVRRAPEGVVAGKPQRRRLPTGEMETALLWNDWFGRPAVLLQLRVPEAITRVGRRALLQSVLVLLGLGLLFVASGGWLAHRRMRRSHEDQLRLQLEARTADLRETEQYLKTIMETVPAGIVIVDAVQHTILDANSAALGMIEARRDEVVGRVCHAFICPAETGRCPISDLGRSCDRDERVLLRADGQMVPVLKTVVPTHLRGRDCLLECFVDIRDQKQADAAIRQSINDLQRMNQAMIGRESRVLELKREINDLLRELGRAARYHEAGGAAAAGGSEA